MDQQKIIHLAGETIVVGGLFLYLLRQIKSLQNEVSEIKETIIKQQQFIDKNFMAVSKTIDFLSLKNKTNERRTPVIPTQRMQTRPSKTKLNAVPLTDEDDQIDDLVFPQNSGTIFVQTVRHPLSNSFQNNTDIVVVEDESEKNEAIDDIDDISEELSQIQSSEDDRGVKETFSVINEEPLIETKNEEEQTFQFNEESEVDKKSKRRKANLKTKK